MAASPVLSVVMPCFNEISTIDEITKRVLESPWVAELVIVDDGSTDGTRDRLAALDDPRVRVILQPRNQGKGAAVRTGFSEARQPFVLVQDADLEYDPAEYERLLEPLVAGRTEVVYGSRFTAADGSQVSGFWERLGNKALTVLSNLLTGLDLTDMETGYKAFRTEVIQDIRIEEDRFGFEPEITAKLTNRGRKIYEVGISYSGRTHEEGKKIGWRDGLRAVYCILRYRNG